jgi:Transglycosylase-like domain
LTFAAPASPGRFLPHRPHLTLAQKVAYFSRSVRHERQVVAWLSSRQAPRTLERRSELRWFRQALAWHTRLLARYRAKLAPVYTDLEAWLCIHRGEGAWTSNTGNGFYGGLQMDLGFQETYGPELLRAKGTADRWTPAEQIMVARRARDSGRGYGPWPNTARVCGLL